MNFSRAPRGLCRRGVNHAIAITLGVGGFALVTSVALAASVQGDGTLVGSTGSDDIIAGNGNDTVWGLGGQDSISAGNGNDVIDANGKCPPGIATGDYPNRLPAGQYCEHGLIPGNYHDNINAGNGNDVIYGGGGHNAINAGSGNDTIYGGPLGDTINVNGRNTGTDNIFLGAGGGNTVSTGQGATVVYAQNGHADTIACHGNTTVYADRVDHTSNCARVIVTPPPSSDGALAAGKTRPAGTARAHRRRAVAKHKAKRRA
jgi:Ca2+-binding RTX toxin-like protein